jgi:peptide/nickel transport system permease protein
MKRLAQFARVVLVGIFLLTLFAGFLSPASYDTQFREVPNAAPSRAHLLGTDELGRDLLARLLYGSRVSLLLAPAAAFLSTVIAALIGGVAGYLGGWWERLALAATDLSLSLPWFFLLVTLRALLPLNVAALTSIVITFMLLGVLGWASAARVLCAGARNLRNADFLLQARACGCRKVRLLFRHVLPNLRPVLVAQFLISIPVFILGEANLGMLGLGVAEPLPSWGSLLRTLENYQSVLDNPLRLAPVGLLLIVITCFQLILPREGFSS